MNPERQPYQPTGEDWEETVHMLCFQCARLHHCDLIEQMIECKDGGEWPAGGWVTDPGAGATCLSYQTRPLTQLNQQEIRAIAASNPPTCQGCAARKGTEANQSLHTRRDFTAAVRTPGLFVCHEDPAGQRPCGGWCQAVTKANGGHPMTIERITNRQQFEESLREDELAREDAQRRQAAEDWKRQEQEDELYQQEQFRNEFGGPA